MKTYQPDIPLISIHVPKSGGSSFRAVLQSWFGKRLLLSYPNERKNLAPKRRSIKSIWRLGTRYRRSLCIHGHFNNKWGYGVLDLYPDVFQHVAVLRDPFDLHLSLYFYVKKLGPNAYFRGKLHPIISAGLTLEQFLEQSPKSFLMVSMPADMTEDNYEEILNSRFVFLGVTEHLQASVEKLSRHLGVPSVAVPNSNVSIWNEPTPDGAKEWFIERNRLEMALYQFALKRILGAGT